MAHDHHMATTMAMDHGSHMNSTMDHGSHMNSTMDHGSHMNSTMDHGSHMNSTMDHSGHEGHDPTSHEMHMTFYFGIENVPILFEEWTVNSSGGMAGACVAVFIVAMLYEGLKVLREILLRKSVVRSSVDKAYSNGQSGDFSSAARVPSVRQTMCSASHWLQTLLHMIQVTVSYALMLIFMSFNGYLAISIVLGAGVGYLAFGWKRAVIVDINEHCH